MKNPLDQNVSPLDRVLRVFVGIALVTLATLVADGTVSVIFIIVSIPLLFSGITGFCPTYTLFGISTASPRNHRMPHMLQACCSTGGHFSSCPPVRKVATDRPSDRSSGTPQNANSEPEGRER